MENFFLGCGDRNIGSLIWSSLDNKEQATEPVLLFLKKH